MMLMTARSAASTPLRTCRPGEKRASSCPPHLCWTRLTVTHPCHPPPLLLLLPPHILMLDPTANVLPLCRCNSTPWASTGSVCSSLQLHPLFPPLLTLRVRVSLSAAPQERTPAPL